MMRSTLAGLLAGFLALPLAAASDQQPDSELLQRQADLVRAVGLVRYFHPHDASASADWNGLLLEAFEIADRTEGDAEFTAGLAELLAGAGFGIEHLAPGTEAADRPACDADEPVIRWVHRGFGAPPVAESGNVYVSRRSVSGVEEAEPGPDFSSAMTTLPAGDWRGHSLRLAGQARLRSDGQAALWVRVDDAGRQMLFFDNMDDRPIEGREWSRHEIEFTVPEEAETIVLGAMVHGDAHGQFRGLVLLDDDRAEGGSLLPEADDWRMVPPEAGHDMAIDQADAGMDVELEPGPARTQQADIDRFMPADAPDRAVVGLLDGSRLVVPLALCEADARLDEVDAEELAARHPAGDLDALDPADLARLDVATLWSVVRHFYPYQEEVEDWDEMLETGLREAGQVGDREAHARVLQRMLVGLKDGHVNVIDARDEAERMLLPIAVQPVDGALYVARSEAGEGLRPGDRIVAVDGEPVEDWIDRELAVHSGSPHWRLRKAIVALLVGAPETTRELTLERGDERIETSLAHAADSMLSPQHHDPVHEPAEGVVYVDLGAVEQSSLDAAISRLADARGVVFDLRGYPRGVSPDFLRHLLEMPDDWDDWMRVMVARAPDGDLVKAQHFGWNLEPDEPAIDAPVVFLANEQAISYAESILGLVKYHGLGTLMGSNTAGSNGNVLPLSLPGDFRALYTGMRVIGPEGEPFQGRGIEPDIRVQPSAQGLREGRDELLERALEFLDNPP